jgi:dihydropteroate synthase
MNRMLRIGNRTFPLGKKTIVMGILNVTPDSFSDGGKYNTVEKALAHARRLYEEGADIIDIGGESTRPGHTPVELEEELERVIPVVEAVAKEIDVPISVDTYKAEVARQAILAGAHLINDVWGAKKEPEIAVVAAQYQVPIILMHNRTEAKYENLIEEMKQDLLESVKIAKEMGVTDEQIILDPGIGFAKTYTDNLEVMRHLDEFVAMGYPVLLGTSRKSLIGKTLNLPPEDRVEGTAATVAYGIVKGCHIVRVHDVKQMVRVCRMMDALVYGVEE